MLQVGLFLTAQSHKLNFFFFCDAGVKITLNISVRILVGVEIYGNERTCKRAEELEKVTETAIVSFNRPRANFLWRLAWENECEHWQLVLL